MYNSYSAHGIIFTTSFRVFLWLPSCLAPQSLKWHAVSPNHRHPFLNHVHIITIYFFGSKLLLCLVFFENTGIKQALWYILYESVKICYHNGNILRQQSTIAKLYTMLIRLLVHSSMLCIYESYIKIEWITCWCNNTTYRLLSLVVLRIMSC